MGESPFLAQWLPCILFLPFVLLAAIPTLVVMHRKTSPQAYLMVSLLDASLLLREIWLLLGADQSTTRMHTPWTSTESIAFRYLNRVTLLLQFAALT